MRCSRRSLLSAIGLTFPFGLNTRAGAAVPPTAPELRFVPFEEAVRAAFAAPDLSDTASSLGQGFPCRRVEVGHSEQIQAGVQGCHNDRPFAGFPAGHLRVIRTGSEPGPVWQGVRLYVSTLDVACTGGPTPDVPSRPLDFASLPAAPTFG